MSLLAAAGWGGRLVVLPKGVALFAGVGAFGGASHLTLADFFASAPAVGLAPASFDCVVNRDRWCCLIVR